MPTSFLVRAGYDESVYKDFADRFREISKGLFHREPCPKKHCVKNMWLIKPANCSQGAGIKVMNSIVEIKEFFRKKSPH